MPVVHSPRGTVDQAPRHPLAETSSPLRRLAVVTTMPPGSGVEVAAENVISALARAGRSVEVVARREFLEDSAEERRDLVDRGFDSVVVVVGPSTSVLVASIAFAANLERAGIRAVLAVPEALEPQREYLLGECDVPLRVIPIGEAGSVDASRCVEAVDSPRTPAESTPGPTTGRDAERTFEGDLDELGLEFERRGWTDGLPVVLPTAERLEAMLAGTSRHPDELVSERFPPEGRIVRVRDVAANAVLAGARSEHLPIILATASLLADASLSSMVRSVNSFAFAQLVSGPLAAAAGMGGGLAALGPGIAANAVIGRSLHLMYRNLGGAAVGLTTSPTQGNAAGWAFAMAENAEQNPWPPLHVERGYPADSTTVTLYTGGQAHLGNFYYDDLDAIAEALTAVDLYSGALVLLSAKRARALAEEGWTRNAVEQALRERATVSLGRFRASGFFPLRSLAIRRGGADTWPASYLTDPDDTQVPAFPPGGIEVAVVGSDVSSLAQAWLMRAAGTAVVDDWV